MIRSNSSTDLGTVPAEASISFGLIEKSLVRNEPRLTWRMRSSISYGGDALRTALRNTIWLSSSFFFSILCGLATSKTYARTVGPEGYGLYGLYSSLVHLAALMVNLGAGNGLARFGSQEWAQGHTDTWRALRHAVRLWTWTGSGICGLALIVLRGVLGRIWLGHPLGVGDAALLALCLMFSVNIGIESTVLKVEQRVKPLAQAEVLASLVATALTVGLLLAAHLHGILPALTAGAIVNWGALVYKQPRHLHIGVRPSSVDVKPALIRVLRYGLVFSVGSLAFSAARSLLPWIVLHRAGVGGVGLYTTATTVGVLYAGFLGSAMGRDYFPRLAGIQSGDMGRLQQTIEDQQELMMVFGLPAILVLMTLAPVVIPLVYSPKFLGAAAIVRWMAAGDLFRFMTWTFSFAVMAQSPVGRFITLELAGSAAYMACSIAGLMLAGLPGLGIGYAVYQVIYLALAYRMCRNHLAIVWSPGARRRLALPVACIAVAVLFTQMPGPGRQLVLLGSETIVVGAICALRARALWARREAPDATVATPG